MSPKKTGPFEKERIVFQPLFVEGTSQFSEMYLYVFLFFEDTVACL